MAGSIVCTASRVMFSSVFTTQKQSHAKHVDIRKTPPGRQEAIMFFSSSRPNSAVPAVKHSNTQSDNNEMSAAAARNCCWKTKVLDCVWEFRVKHFGQVISGRASIIQLFSFPSVQNQLNVNSLLRSCYIVPRLTYQSPNLLKCC